MTVPEILFIVAIALFVLAFVLIALAVVVFFTRNIPDVRADLTGKKRAEAVAEIDSSRARERRRSSRRDGSQGAQATGLGTGQVATPAADSPIRVVEPQIPAQEVPAPQRIVPQPQPLEDEVATTILPDDMDATVVFSQEPVAEDTVVASPPDRGSSAASLEGFRIVRKIVLMESQEVVRPGQGA